MHDYAKYDDVESYDSDKDGNYQDGDQDDGGNDLITMAAATTFTCEVRDLKFNSLVEEKVKIKIKTGLDCPQFLIVHSKKDL